ncbi:MAG TPA: hypothetical protein VK625_05630 [Flavitalea sp.]|nr:hypothetical protein [Flavitalea sp.]
MPGCELLLVVRPELNQANDVCSWAFYGESFGKVDIFICLFIRELVIIVLFCVVFEKTITSGYKLEA